MADEIDVADSGGPRRSVGSENWSALVCSPDPRVYELTAAVIDLAECLRHDDLVYWTMVFDALLKIRDVFKRAYYGMHGTPDPIKPEEPWLATTLNLLPKAIDDVWNENSFDRVPVPNPVEEDYLEKKFARAEWDWPTAQLPASFQRQIARIKRALTALPKLENWVPEWRGTNANFRAEQRRQGKSSSQIESECQARRDTIREELVRQEIASDTDADECQWPENRDQFWPGNLPLTIHDTWLYRQNLDGPLPLRSLTELRDWLIRTQQMMDERSSPGSYFEKIALSFGVIAGRDCRRWLKHFTGRSAGNFNEPQTVLEADRAIEAMLAMIDAGLPKASATVTPATDERAGATGHAVRVQLWESSNTVSTSVDFPGRSASSVSSTNKVHGDAETQTDIRGLGDGDDQKIGLGVAADQLTREPLRPIHLSAVGSSFFLIAWSCVASIFAVDADLNSAASC